MVSCVNRDLISLCQGLRRWCHRVLRCSHSDVVIIDDLRGDRHHGSSQEKRNWAQPMNGPKPWESPLGFSFLIALFHVKPVKHSMYILNYIWIVRCYNYGCQPVAWDDPPTSPQCTTSSKDIIVQYQDGCYISSNQPDSRGFADVRKLVAL